MTEDPRAAASFESVSRDGLEAATRQVYSRYVREFVEALNLCPWALDAREGGEVDVRVLTMDAWDRGAVEAAIDGIAGDPTRQIGILIFPRLDLSRSTWTRTVADLQASEARRHGDAGPPMAMAAFHPDGPSDISTPGRLTAFIRRSPDVTLQLVRQSTLEAIRNDEQLGTGYVDMATVDLEALLDSQRPRKFHERLVDANRKSIQRFGVERADALLRELRDERLRR